MRVTIVCLISAILFFGVMPQPGHGQSEPAAQPPKVRELGRLLEDPEVRSWLEEVRMNEAARPTIASPASAGLADRLSGVRDHLRTVSAAIPLLSFGTKMPPEAPMFGQERAYTSPIWYTPKG